MHLINLIIVEIIINCNDPISNNSLSNGNIITSRSSPIQLCKNEKTYYKKVRCKNMEKIRDIMTDDVECCSLLDNVYEVAVKMKELNVGAIPIVDQGKLVGMITDRDIVLRCIAEKHPASSKVEDIMSSDLITISVDANSKEAVQLMAKHQIRRLPVVEGGKLIGIVSLGDFAVRELTDDQAKSALSDISETSQSQMNH
jgi:CBS domain-containing protein